MTQNCEVGDEGVVSLLLSKLKTMLNKNSDMVRVRDSLRKQIEEIAVHEMCSESAQQQLKLSLADLHARQVIP